MTSTSVSSSATILRARNLSKRVSSQGQPLTILSGVNLEVNRGDSVAIVGASGSGKSTLLGLLAGLDSESEGEIELDGVAFSGLNQDQRAALRSQRVGFVFQNFQLLPALSALENVMLPLELAGHPQPRQEAERLLGEVGLAARQQHHPRQLSGGEQQRVAIARAFACHPAILFADEPTGNLDHHTGAAVIELLFRLNRQQGTTLILVTHDPALAARCHRRLQLVEGHLEAQP